MNVNIDMSIGYPYKVYLTIISNGAIKEPSDFKINVKYVKYNTND